jgi:hypothetical protein
MLRPQGHFKQGSFKQGHFEPARRWNFWNSPALILAANGIISLILIGLVVFCPPASRWISEAVEAEIAGIALPDATPTKTAQPSQETRTARNN